MNNFDLLGKHISEIDDVLDSWVERTFAMNYNYFAVLYSLAGAENGQCTQKQIGDEWYMPKQTVFNICKEFREKGWIEFYPSPTDKRERIMCLTESGKQQAEPIYRTTIDAVDRAFKVFGKQKTAQLFALMAEFSAVCREEMNK
ncbi:MarR family winged helix-turn-helix transcriptional regulator [Aggregatibacter kilianii]|uniref:MarR family winged helix-turn-helix transcriptional regulator n=1 Tax=Aggregatibacter kilianii TaxID=2025884 RepID=UPI000D64FF8F|nr:MarR family winged helix-turn-helix transcriptional regulator [Aggregatibacter kilianii]